MALTKADLKKASEHVKWMVKELEQGRLDKYDRARIPKDVVHQIYIMCSNLTNPSFGVNAKWENSNVKNTIERIEYQIALARNVQKSEKFGVTKKEVDDAVKFTHAAIKNTKERFKLNNIIDMKYERY